MYIFHNKLSIPLKHPVMASSKMRNKISSIPTNKNVSVLCTIQ